MSPYLQFLFGLALVVPGARGAESPVQNEYFVYIGTYTKSHSKGIYVCRFNEQTGKITSLGLAAETINPSFLVANPSGRYLYAVNEVESFEGQQTGSVSAFSIDQQTGKLTLLNQVPSHGAIPAHISMDKTGQYVLVANYNGGSVAVFPVQTDGRLGKMSSFVQHKGSSVNPFRQSGPHAHSIEVSPDNRFAITADLGLDKVLVYHFDHGKLSPDDPAYATVKPGSGPRHFVFSPSGKFVYVISEMGSTVTVFTYNEEDGAMRELQTISTLPKDFKGESTGAEIQISPFGRFLYASNRGSDTIAVFAIDATKGTLTPVEYAPTQGKTPRMFAIDPSGAYLFAANQDSGTVVIFRISPKTGRLTPTGEEIKVASPVCVTFVPAH